MKPSEEFPHYFRDVSHLKTIDVYRIIDLFGVTDPCDQHALKKILAGGKRGAKDSIKDTKEAIVTLRRKLEMLEENEAIELADLANGDMPELSEEMTKAGYTPVTINSYVCVVGPWIENPGRMPVPGKTSVQVKTRTKVLDEIRPAHSLGWSNRDGHGPSITHYRIVK